MWPNTILFPGVLHSFFSFPTEIMHTRRITKSRIYVSVHFLSYSRIYRCSCAVVKIHPAHVPSSLFDVHFLSTKAKFINPTIFVGYKNTSTCSTGCQLRVHLFKLKRPPSRKGLAQYILLPILIDFHSGFDYLLKTIFSWLIKVCSPKVLGQILLFNIITRKIMGVLISNATA
jgi:hypothetical protein